MAAGGDQHRPLGQDRPRTVLGGGLDGGHGLRGAFLERVGGLRGDLLGGFEGGLLSGFLERLGDECLHCLGGRLLGLAAGLGAQQDRPRRDRQRRRRLRGRGGDLRRYRDRSGSRLYRDLRRGEGHRRRGGGRSGRHGLRQDGEDGRGLGEGRAGRAGRADRGAGGHGVQHRTRGGRRDRLGDLDHRLGRAEPAVQRRPVRHVRPVGRLGRDRGNEGRVQRGEGRGRFGLGGDGRGGLDPRCLDHGLRHGLRHGAGLLYAPLPTPQPSPLHRNDGLRAAVGGAEEAHARRRHERAAPARHLRDGLLGAQPGGLGLLGGELRRALGGLVLRRLTGPLRLQSRGLSGGLGVEQGLGSGLCLALGLQRLAAALHQNGVGGAGEAHRLGQRRLRHAVGPARAGLGHGQGVRDRTGLRRDRRRAARGAHENARAGGAGIDAALERHVRLAVMNETLGGTVLAGMDRGGHLEQPLLRRRPRLGRPRFLPGRRTAEHRPRRHQPARDRARVEPVGARMRQGRMRKHVRQRPRRGRRCPGDAPGEIGAQAHQPMGDAADRPVEAVAAAARPRGITMGMGRPSRCAHDL